MRLLRLSLGLVKWIQALCRCARNLTPRNRARILSPNERVQTSLGTKEQKRALVLNQSLSRAADVGEAAPNCTLAFNSDS